MEAPIKRNEAVLRGALNLTAELVEVCAPWEFQSEVPASAMVNKEAFKHWSEDPRTEHNFYTGTEAMNPRLRVSKNNPAVKLHGLIADFDNIFTDTELENIVKRCAAQLVPNYQSRTFSGGARLIWMFEGPVAMEVEEIADKFLAIAYNALRVEKLLAGIDKAAWKRTSQLYAVGNDWKQLSTERIPLDLLNAWSFEAAQKVNTAKLTDVSVPLEVVEEEVQKRFPGRWSGAFAVGKRGCVFFEADSTNQTAAIVTEGGMICFSTERQFYSWRDIFGTAFVRQYEQDRIGRVTTDTYFDGRYYYTRAARGGWNGLSKEDYSLWLRTKHGLNPTKRGETASEVDRALLHVQEHARVDGVAPKVYCREDMFWDAGLRFLNNARVKVVPPAEGAQQWGTNFPWLAEFLDTCWDSPAEEQKEHFLDWLRRFYVGALQGELQKGHALFLGGPVGTGKSLLIHVLSLIAGGSAPADSFLIKQSGFNKSLLERGLWQVDDGVPCNDPNKHQEFSENVKKFVANNLFTYAAKFKDDTPVSWDGRLVVAFNDNEIGIRMVPALEPSIEDKLMLLRFSREPRVFPERRELQDVINRELPYFLRWLLDWTPPAHLQNGGRFGRNYIHPGLRLLALSSGTLGDLFGLLEQWVKRTCVQETGPYWEGTATDLFAALSSDYGNQSLLKNVTPASLGRKLSQAAQHPDTGITLASKRTRHKGKSPRFRIELGLYADLDASASRSPVPA